MSSQSEAAGDGSPIRGDGGAVGVDTGEIERIAGEIRQAIPYGTGQTEASAGDRSDEPSAVVSYPIDRSTVTARGPLAPVKRALKLLLGKAIRGGMGGIAVEIQRLGGEVDRIDRVHEAERAESEATTADLRRELAALRDRLRRLERREDASRSPAAPAPSAAPPVAGSENPQAALDYFAFEALMRGSTDEIAERQSEYVTLFQDVDDVLDVGCGRGELLELLVAAGKRVRGVDVNEDMVVKCIERGLDVHHSDGTTYLADQSEGSLGGVVALQVVEHLRPAELVAFLEQSRRALRDGGILVLETINPASLSALQNYFADLTHRQPLVPRTLAFLVESAGFRDVQIEYRSPLPEIARLRHIPFGPKAGEGVQAASDRNVDLVNAALFGPQDFAVIARA